MVENAFDDVARRAADGVSRRGSLLALGGAVAATFAGVSTVKAGKAGKKAKKKCRKQGAPCNEFSNALCAEFFPPGPGRDQCVAAATACCPSLARCQAGLFFDCAFDVIQGLVP